MKDLIKILLGVFLMMNLTGCGVFFATGNWWNLDYAKADEMWVHPTILKDKASIIKIQCSDTAIEVVTGTKQLSALPNEKQNEVIRNISHAQSLQYTRLQEQCYLDHGFKFYPRGIKRDHPTVCFGESKKSPGCQSVFDIPIL